MDITQYNKAARVWVYQANEPFADTDIAAVIERLADFMNNWASHGRQLTAGADLLHNRFVVLAVDETQGGGASGCSIDSSVAFLKQLGAAYERDLFDRMRFSYQTADGQVVTCSKDEFANKYAAGEINDTTIVFDPLVKTVDELANSFKKELQNSWHKRFV